MWEETVVQHIRALFGSGHTFQARNLNGEAFTVTLNNEGVDVSNLGALPFLPWTVFIETIRLLKERGGRAPVGNAMNSRLGHGELPLECVEGYVALTVYQKKIGDTVFRRRVPVTGILISAGLCDYAEGQLLLTTSFKEVANL
ncbi:hypothetical protein VPH49_23935 [Pseudomonas luteola]|uniref:hypothetical protein n=1 Tax=Pseudomonas luteola TaxID=47886 RepID=UPI00123A0338|nr:hypothetical protein [Pseudomonas luteola]QEU26275.1 hypothetical protein FOB45_00165 [Pseudomonas luteola]